MHTDEDLDAASQRYARLLLFMFVILAFCMVSIGYLYVKDHEAQYRERAMREVSAIAALKAAELVRWRTERLADAEVHFHNATFAELVARSLEGSGDERAQEQLRGWLEHVRRAYHYDHIYLTNTEGRLRMAVMDKSSGKGMIAHIGAAVATDRVSFLDFHKDTADGADHLSVVVPVREASGSGKPLGMLYLGIDPRNYLYPFIESWPTPSRTAETLLVRRDGDHVLFLNELRFQKNTALSLRIPLDNSDVAAVKAVLGQEGTVEGRDYRGVAVIASLHRIPDSPWFLVARMDTEEALEPAHQALWLVSGLVALLLVAAAVAVAFTLRRQRSRFHEARNSAAEALAASMARHRSVTQSASTAIITADADGLITGWNPAAERIFGYAETEVIGLALETLMPERYRQQHNSGMVRVADGGANSMLFRTVELDGLTRSGDEFPMELTLSRWETTSGAFVTGIVRDISRRRQGEQALRESEEIFRHFMEFSPMYVFFNDVNLRTLRLSRNFEKLLGKPMEEMIGRSMDELFHYEFAKNIVENDTRVMREGRSITVTEEFRGRYYLTTRFPIIIDGKPRYLAGYTTDITERKHAQESSRQAHEQLRQLTVQMNTRHEAEYSLLSRELHDEFGQLLTSLKMDLSWLSIRLGEDKQELRQKVALSMALVDASVESVHRIAARLRPRILDDLGLVSAIDWLVQDCREHTGINAEFVANAEVSSLDLERSTAVFRIVQESLSNIVRHSEAKCVVISLDCEDGWLRLEIRDDGKGLLEEKLTNHESIGLLGMRERALAAGGELELSSVVGKGTMVVLRLPLAREVA